jgi:hypothetical protein
LYDFRRRLQTNEHKLCVRGDRPNPLGRFYAIQIPQADIDQNEIRLQLFRLLNSFQSIRHFPNDSEVRPFLKLQTNKSAERLMVLDYKDPVGSHRTGVL